MLGIRVLRRALVLGIATVLATPAAAFALDCPRHAGKYQHGVAAKPAAKGKRKAGHRHRHHRPASTRRIIGLAVEGAPGVINFAARPGQGVVDVVLKPGKPVPRGIRPANIAIDVPRQLRRDGDTLKSVDEVMPTFTVPQFSATRDRIFFTVCVDSSDLKPGSYSGLLAVSGPKPLGHVDIVLTVHRKNSFLFWVGAFAALLLTIALLAFKELRNERKDGYASWKTREQAKTPAGSTSGWCYFTSAGVRFGLDFWALECLVPIGAAFGAMYAVYATTPIWGADGLTSCFALLTTAFAAAGVRSLIVAVR